MMKNMKKIVSGLLVFACLLGMTYVPVHASDGEIELPKLSFCDMMGHNIVNGQCTICGTKEVEFSGNSLNLGGEIGVNFYVNLSDEAKTEDAYMEFAISGRNGETTTQTLEEAVLQANGSYKFSRYVNSVQMADTITATYHYGEKTAVKEYSVKTYLDKGIAHPEMSDTVKALFKAIGNYGHYAQILLSVEKGWTIGVDHAEMPAYDELDKEIDLSEFAYSQTGSVAGITSVGRSLSLASKTAICLYFNVDGSYDDVPYVTVNGDVYELTKSGANQYKLVIPNVLAHKLGSTYTIVVDGTMTIKMSALSYANIVLNAETGDGLKDCMYALNKYYETAVQYGIESGLSD